jgi:hypothetical protein
MLFNALSARHITAVVILCAVEEVFSPKGHFPSKWLCWWPYNVLFQISGGNQALNNNGRLPSLVGT